ncbi:PQQ-dependent sugar dehydrogenase [Nocardioides panaciterrulae]|uniref:Glucose/arabinose dehydrogenase n=1 Tax=Nocardioides panaciterrulae TaxID=661492 RepID=A0A7Y9E6Y9_9ACTN|nr:glucose/arabinose dehydrogenase [Nocardioides panaciterrulae]
MPALRVRTLVTGLDHPWDVQPIGGGRLLYTQRDRATLSVWDHGHHHRVKFPSGQVWVKGRAGLMSLEVDPDFAHNGRFYTCQGGYTRGGGHQIHVLAWHLDDRATRAREVGELLGGIPADPQARHSGCRLLIVRDGSLLVGTGDGYVGTNAEDLTSLGGKTLRLNRFTGRPWPTNPFVHARDRHKRYVQTYGHRNIQGLAQRSDGSLWQVEQGTYVDDEVNRLVNGGDYGFNPVSAHGTAYNENAPMTDPSLPGKQVQARWRSGSPTLATSGCRFVRGSKWGALDGTLAVAALKASRVIFLTFDASGHLRKVRAPAALQHDGRLRSVTVAPNNDLLITTDNGNGQDAILRVSPR